jgi:hypothetical protein
MTSARKKPVRETITRAASKPARDLAPEAAPPRGFPTALDALRSSDVKAIIESAVRAAAWAGVVASSVALSGCHEPECAPTRADELNVHGEEAVNAALDLRFRDSLHQLGYGTGLATHPPFYSMPLAGAIAIPMESLPPEIVEDEKVPDETGLGDGSDATPDDAVE